MNIGIVGQGFVGDAIYKKFKSYYEVFTYDLDKDKCNSTLEIIVQKCGIVFLCLPTPMESSGACSTDILRQALDDLNFLGYRETIVIKSTVPPGTTDELNSIYSDMSIVFNPEFLSEVSAEEDFKNTTRVILGGPRPSTTLLKQVYVKVFPNATIVKTGAAHAEMVKYFTNAFLATKVTFANEVYRLCEAINLDYDKVVEYATLDPRIGKAHLAVPGPDGELGFGGHCLPKDLNALVYLYKSKGIDPIFFESVLELNDTVRENKDWLELKGRAVV
jgi:UDPglucose 6-dehydrogenase